jgi:hypothetical protein
MYSQTIEESDVHEFLRLAVLKCGNIKPENIKWNETAFNIS